MKRENIENVVDVSGFLRKKRIQDSKNENQRIYEKFIRETLDQIYLSPPVCCSTNSVGLKVYHLSPNAKGAAKHDIRCASDTAHPGVEKSLADANFGIKETTNGAIHFTFLRRENVEQLRLVFRIGASQFDKVVPKVLNKAITDASILAKKFVIVPSVDMPMSNDVHHFVHYVDSSSVDRRSWGVTFA